VYSNEFDALDLGSNWTGQVHDWYTSEYGAVKAPAPTRESVSNSVLSLDWLAGDGAGESTISSFDVGSQKGRAFRYGYYEARMKWNPVTGAWPAFWLLSLQNTTNNGQWGELDVFEGQGAQSSDYFGTVHSWTAVNGSRSSTFNSNNNFKLTGVDYSQWHTYGVLWQPGSITWYFDNNPIITAPEPSIMQTQDMELIFDSTVGVNWSGGNTSGVTASDIPLNVDWVHVWQRNPSTVTISTGGTAYRGN
jgi:beta-glucanase (GH16 family)